MRAAHYFYTRIPPLKSPQTDPFQTPSKFSHPNYPSSTQLLATFPSHKTSYKTEKPMYSDGRHPTLHSLNNMQCSFCSAFTYESCVLSTISHVATCVHSVT